MAKMKWYDWTAVVLLIVGGVNWGLVGFFNYDLVAKIFGYMTFLSRTVYVLVGVSAIYSFYSLWKVANRK